MAKAIQTPLTRTARLLDLVPYLSSHQGIELVTLAKEFDVTQNQMVADLTTLWMCGLPGYTPLELMDLSFDSGYVTIHNAETLARPRTLSSEESIALLLGLDLVVQSLPDNRGDLKNLARGLVEKLARRSNVPAKLSAVPVVDGSIRALVEKAISGKGSLEIVYHSSYSDSITTRIVHPIQLLSESGTEYLSGICQNARSLRTFRLDRIQSAKLTSKPKLPIPDLLGINNAVIPYTIHVHSRPREIMERFGLTKELLDGDSHLTSFSMQWITRSVLASSGSVELIEPAQIRLEIASAAALILNRYKAL